MTFVAGHRLGPYEILGTLGAGGMGVVYRARDTRLRREVALRVLPDRFTDDSERLDRFRREAVAIASLDHPNIVTIYAVEELDGVHCLAMKFIEGATLASHIGPGRLPVGTMIKIALSLTDAIGAAHARGIVHRDLKPANVMIGPDGLVTVLDFGLAKLRQSVDDAHPVTMTTMGVTDGHQVLGTVAYMSPEQAEGRAVDARSDIFSLGIMLYEMATGTRPFQGHSNLAVISSILKDAPPSLSQVRPDLPGDLDRIVRRCLAKEPDRRYQTALDVRNELEDLQQRVADSPRPARGRWRGAMTPVAGAAALALAGVVLYTWWRSPSRDPRVAPLRVSVDRVTSQPAAELFPSLSPDGKWVVYSGEGAGNRDIFLQSVSGQTPINLTADSPEDDDQPSFSPDGERIAFRSSRGGGGLFVMGRTGEGVRRVTAAGFNPAWSPDGKQLVYTTVATDIKPQNAEQRGDVMTVAVDGGTPRNLYQGATLPNWSPSGKRIAFGGRLTASTFTSNIGTMAIAGGDALPVTNDAYLNWNPVWSHDGRYLYFVSNRGGSMNIWRVAVDEASGRPQGEPEPVTTPATFATHLSLSASGDRLAYTAVSETQNIQRLQLNPASGDVLGEPVPVTTGSRFWANPDPSPDGKWVVFYSQVGPEGDLYIARSDGSGGIRQLTSDKAVDRVPRWSPDGEWIEMFSDRSGKLQVWKVRIDGSELQQVTKKPSSVAAWSPDGKRLAVTRSGQPDSGSIVDAQPPFEDHVVDLEPPPASRFAPNAWSPDGKWIAGVNGFRTPGLTLYSLDAHAYTTLTDWGEWPVWLPDSRRILFVSRGREFHLIDIRTRKTTKVFSAIRDTIGPPRLTRDGHEAYFSRRVTEADVWLATIR